MTRRGFIPLGALSRRTTFSEITKGWNNLPWDQLETVLWQARRFAAERHLSQAEWSLIDRIRKRVENRRKESCEWTHRPKIRPRGALECETFPLADQ